MRTASFVALGLMALWPLTVAAQEPPAPPGPPPAEAPPPPPPGGPGPMHPGMMHPHGPMGMMELGPVIRLRYGGLALSLRCSPRDDASACADAALKVLDRLRQMPASEDSQGDAEGDHSPGGDTGDGDNDGGNDGDSGDNQQ